MSKGALNSLEDVVREYDIADNSFVLLSGSRGKGIGLSASDWDVIVVRMKCDPWPASTVTRYVLKWLSERGWMNDDLINEACSGGQLIFNFEAVSQNVQVWTTNFESLRVLTSHFYVPFLVEALRLVYQVIFLGVAPTFIPQQQQQQQQQKKTHNTLKDPAKNLFFVEPRDAPLSSEERARVETTRAALKSGLQWFDPVINWADARASFSRVCRDHLSRAVQCNGQPLCRKLGLHILSFVTTAHWLAGHQPSSDCTILPNSYDFSLLSEPLVTAVDAMEKSLLALEHPTRDVSGWLTESRKAVPKGAWRRPVDLTLANNRTLLVQLPILDLILHLFMMGSPAPREVFVLLQTSRLFRTKVEALLRDKLYHIGLTALSASAAGRYEGSQWCPKILSKSLTAGKLLNLWTRFYTIIEMPPTPCWQCGKVQTVIDVVRDHMYHSSAQYGRPRFAALEDAVQVTQCPCQYNAGTYSSGITRYAVVPASAHERWKKCFPAWRRPDNSDMPRACFYCEAASLNPGRIQRGQTSEFSFFVCENHHIWSHEEVYMHNLNWRFVYGVQPTCTLSYEEQWRLSRAQTPCKMWKKGHCPNGDKCQYKHGAKDPKPQKICFQWAEKGACSRPKCRFVHENNTSAL